jgi:hypothetical protein
VKKGLGKEREIESKLNLCVIYRWEWNKDWIIIPFTTWMDRQIDFFGMLSFYTVLYILAKINL